MLRRNFSLTNPSNELIRGDLRHREDAKNAPVVIICHGFKGFKDWGFFPILAERLADSGYIALTFNFSRNGVGADSQNFTELEKFTKNTYTHELDDLKFIVDSITSGNLGQRLIDKEKIGLLGHSRGGGIAILHAANDDRIQTLVTWSAISTVERYTVQQIESWEKDGFLEFENKRTKQIMRIDIDLIKDIKKNKKKLNILNAASKIEIPILIIHGENDEAVPKVESQDIYDKLETSSKDLIIIEGGTHTYSISHPMESISNQFETVLDLTENWFDRYLNE